MRPIVCGCLGRVPGGPSWKKAAPDHLVPGRVCDERCDRLVLFLQRLPEAGHAIRGTSAGFRPSFIHRPLHDRTVDSADGRHLGDIPNECEISRNECAPNLRRNHHVHGDENVPSHRRQVRQLRDILDFCVLLIFRLSVYIFQTAGDERQVLLGNPTPFEAQQECGAGRRTPRTIILTNTIIYVHTRILNKSAIFYKRRRSFLVISNLTNKY